jgi:hypothetical protein
MLYLPLPTNLMRLKTWYYSLDKLSEQVINERNNYDKPENHKDSCYHQLHEQTFKTDVHEVGNNRSYFYACNYESNSNRKCAKVNACHQNRNCCKHKEDYKNYCM